MVLPGAALPRICSYRILSRSSPCRQLLRRPSHHVRHGLVEQAKHATLPTDSSRTTNQVITDLTMHLTMGMPRWQQDSAALHPCLQYDLASIGDLPAGGT